MKVKFECVNEKCKVAGFFDTENDGNGICWLDDNGNERGNSFPPNPYDINEDEESFEEWRRFKDSVLLNYHVIIDTLKKFKYSKVEVNHWYYLLKVN